MPTHASARLSGPHLKSPTWTLPTIFIHRPFHHCQVRRSLAMSEMLDRHKVLVGSLEGKRQAQDAEWGRIMQVREAGWGCRMT